ncbi:hypothetical protein ABFV99_25640 [Cytobacillus horneckiae]|uniref:phage baseplate protein n=1 Tax=Cytobacillus horneckiae TaxID=549687 RepID=UPI0034CDBA4D
MANIQPFLNKIRTAIFGKEVRGSLADGLEAVNNEVIETTNLSKNTQRQQEIIDKKYTEQIENSTDITEIKDFHVSGVTGEVFQTMGKRADALEVKYIENVQGIDVLKKEQKSYDILSTSPSYYTTLNLPQGDIMQGFYFSENAKHMFSVVAKKPSDGTEETFTLYRLTNTGKILDYMTLDKCGHGTVLGLEPIEDEIYFWSDIPTGVNGHRLSRFKYEPYAVYIPSSNELVKYNNFGGNEYVYPSIDGEYIIFCRQSTGSWVVEKRLLEDVKMGVNNLLYSVNIPPSLKWMQGFAADGDDLYWLSGDDNGANYPMILTCFDFTTGEITKDIPIDFAENTSGIIENDYQEPEGLFLYKDSTGAKSLFVGVATGNYIVRNNKVFAFHSLINDRKFMGYKTQDIPRDVSTIQKSRITGDDGRELFYIRANETITNTLKNFRGLATIYCEAGVSDAPDPTTSCRIEANIQNIGVGRLTNIDWLNRMWFTSMVSGSLNDWERVQTYNLIERPWIDLTLKNGAKVAWDYKPQYRRVNNLIQLKGVVIPGSSKIIGTLPPAYKSTRLIRKVVACDGIIDNARMTIQNSTGNIEIDFNEAEAVWLDCEFDANM